MYIYTYTYKLDYNLMHFQDITRTYEMESMCVHTTCSVCIRNTSRV